MSNLFDLLDIDEATGIDPKEVVAIKNTLARIQVVAGTVAKNNDAPTTLAILRAMEDVMRNVSGVTSVDQLHQALAKDSTGAPAKALGAGPAGTPSDDDARKAMAIILGAPGLPNGFKHLLRRAYDQTALDHLEVGDDGTPNLVVTLKKQVTDLTRERDTLQKAGDEFVKLLDAVKAESGLNPNTGEESDAFVKRAFKTSGAPAPADMIKKADVKKAADEAIKAVQAEKAPTIGKVIEGHDAALKAVQALVDLAK